MNAKTTILPSGFYDMLAEDAALEYRALADVVACLQGAGYAYVRPPLMEFEETLLLQADSKLRGQTMRVMDAESGQMMGLRADMTPQIARIAETRLSQEARPLRLCYSGQVVRASAIGVSNARQWTQAGLERIGQVDVAAIVELLVDAVQALEKSGISEITIDISLPRILPILLADVAERDMLTRMVAQKDIEGLRAQDVAVAAVLADILACSGVATEAIEAVEKLAALDLLGQVEQQIAELSAVVAALSLDGVTLTVDVLEQGGFDYYTGLAFALFARGAAEELGRGGCYELPRSGEMAVGCSFHMDAVTRAL